MIEIDFHLGANETGTTAWARAFGWTFHLSSKPPIFSQRVAIERGERKTLGRWHFEIAREEVADEQRSARAERVWRRYRSGKTVSFDEFLARRRGGAS